MDRQDWRSSEKGLVASLFQARDLLREGLRRPWRALLISAVLSLALVAAIAFSDREHAPKFVIRVVEADRDSSGMPRLKRRLADYVREGVLISEPLLELMRRHGLYPSLMSKNLRAALESFREDISIDVFQNYFVEARAPGAVPRSARLTVSYRSKDPTQALAVTRDLGRLIIAHEQAVRREQAAMAASDADQARDSLRRALEMRAGQAVVKQTQMARAAAPDPRLQVELVGLLGSVGALQQQLEAAERRAASLELGAALERRGMGLYFEVVEEGALPSRAGRERQLLLVFGSALLTGLPLVAMTIAAFGSPRGLK
ncbi:MAG TPA: hypothetical protein VJN18_33570 [Polyangiaceae bacterium]|nr:hypothetical protein [Polyangiaceae bacterium]